MARVESEAGIIATLIHHPEFSYYSEQLLPNHFTNEENRYIYQAICSLARDGITTIDPYNIIQALSAKEATRRFAGRAQYRPALYIDGQQRQHCSKYC